MRRPEAQPALLGSLEEQVMLAVLRTGDEAYGMNVRRELEDVTGRDVTSGSVYATLDRLEAKGYVTSARPTGGEAPSRSIFEVTKRGHLSLALPRATRERLWAGVRLKQS